MFQKYFGEGNLSVMNAFAEQIPNITPKYIFSNYTKWEKAIAIGELSFEDSKGKMLTQKAIKEQIILAKEKVKTNLIESAGEIGLDEEYITRIIKKI
jgi:hypothetical protein